MYNNNFHTTDSIYDVSTLVSAKFDNANFSFLFQTNCNSYNTLHYDKIESNVTLPVQVLPKTT